MNSKQHEILKGWLPALIWLAIIAVESTSIFSAENTGRWLYPFFHFLTGVDAARFAVWHHYMRKTGHFVGYFTLSLLLFRAWRATLPLQEFAERLYPWSIRWARISFFMTALVACLDEWHQSYLPSRTGTVRDVLLDSAAAFTAQIVILLFLRTRSKQADGSPQTFPHEASTDNV
ncbi:MAG: VanZ family protein [Terriglobales bacterium]